MHTVLVVEDEKMIRQGICTMIKRSGVPVEMIMECNNGQAALEVLKNQKVDVMFTDIRMPKMDGIQLVQKMQELPHKPLTVAISGYDDFSYAVEMLRNGIQEYILKPVDRNKLREVLLKMEEKLCEEQEKDTNIRIIGCRQFKQIMETDCMPEKELESIRNRFENMLLYPQYYVCCTEQEGDEAEEKDAYLYLEQVGDCKVYLVNDADLRFLLKNELRESYVGVSALHHGITELRMAYQEAEKARKEAFCKCSHVILTEETIIREENESDRQKMHAEAISKIVQMIGTDKVTEAIHQTEQFIGKVRQGGYAPEEFEEFAKKLISGIIVTYQNALEEEREILKQLKNPYEYANIEDYMEELTGFMIAFHEKINTRFDDYGNKQKMQQAVEYIRQNYNKDLNMAVVSNYVSMNYSLFSFVFKQYTGKNFVNYLKELRMEEAKRLLANTQMRVIEISQQIGYENEKHFMKIFKSVCGVSPTEYRKNMEFTKQ
ncbi:MAG: response regulator [Lachnospiraceae bacterium]